MNLVTAYHASAPTQVDFAATVEGPPHFFYGRRSHAEHESFWVRSAAGPIEVIDNVNLAPPIAVRRGDSVEVAGVMVHDPGHIPRVHWTHHDPSGRHPGGFIRWRGRLYA
ncbi:MAG TPA: DUF3465 domain-containing protein [Candidatus Dormibacteraeota bacterium]|nr:DUF3465 domain-containing protein [Candidatus Dormibacteraeota bacterium]